MKDRSLIQKSELMPKKKLFATSEWFALLIVQIYFAFVLWVSGPKLLVLGLTFFALVDLLMGVLVYFVVKRRFTRANDVQNRRGKLRKTFDALYPPIGSLALMLLIGFGGSGKSNLLVLASNSGNDTAIKLLISIGTNINQIAMDDTPLTAAAKSNRPSTVEMLLMNGANVDTPARNGKTALSIALERHNTKVVSLLRAAGAH